MQNQIQLQKRKGKKTKKGKKKDTEKSMKKNEIQK